MEKINQIMQQAIQHLDVKQPPAQPLAKILATRLVGSETTVIKLKYAQPPICAMAPEVGLTYVQGLVKRIHVITGWAIPELEEDRHILFSEMYNHLVETWPSFNAEEIAYSVRTYGPEIENWGKNINLVLLDKCIGKYYTHERQEASKREEQKKVPETHRIAPPFDWRECAETNYQLFLANKLKLELLPAEILGELEKSELVPPGLDKGMLPHAEKKVFAQFRAKEAAIIAGKDNANRNQLNAEFDRFIEQGAQYYAVVALSKKLAVIKYFHFAAKQGCKNIFVKVVEHG